MFKTLTDLLSIDKKFQLLFSRWRLVSHCCHIFFLHLLENGTSRNCSHPAWHHCNKSNSDYSSISIVTQHSISIDLMSNRYKPSILN